MVWRGTGAWSLLIAAAFTSCGEAELRVEHGEVKVSFTAPAAEQVLPLSTATEVMIQASSDAGPVREITLVVEAMDCPAGQACARLFLSRSGDAVSAGHASFCVTTQLAPADVCAEEQARLDVSGLSHGAGLRLSALASAGDERRFSGRAAPIAVSLLDDRAPLVTLESALSMQDGRWGPGDRVAVVVRAVDEQSGVRSLTIRTSGLEGIAETEESWSFPQGAVDVLRTVTIAVPQDYLCPGTFHVEVEAGDHAEPENRSVVALGDGCVGVCSDHSPAGLLNVALEYEGSRRDTPHAQAGEELQLSFEIDDDLFLGQDPRVELVRSSRDSIAGTFDLVEAVGRDDQVPGARYLFSYRVRGSEAPGRYLVRVRALDPRCNASIEELPLVIDYTPSPLGLRLLEMDRGTTQLWLAWDLSDTSGAPLLHLLSQAAPLTPVEASYEEVLPGPAASPFLHQGLTPATAYAYRLLAQSEVTPEISTDAAELYPACTLPAAPGLTVVKSSQSSLELSASVVPNPAGTRLELQRCRGTGCGIPGACAEVEGSCELAQDVASGTLLLDELQPDTCYRVELRAFGCEPDVATSALCERTSPVLPAPAWVEVTARGENSVTFGWQLIAGGDEDPVIGYEVERDGGGAQIVPQPASGAEVSLVVDGLSPGQAVSLRLRGLRQSGARGFFSEIISAHALAVSPPAVIAGTSGDDRLSLVLSTGGNGDVCATTYRVYDRSSGRHVDPSGAEVMEEVFAPLADGCPGAFPRDLVVSALFPDSDHVFSIVARNGDGLLSDVAPDSSIATTLAQVPPAPHVRSDGAGGLVIVLDAGENPARTTYAIAFDDGRYAALGGRRADVARFATRSEWHGGTGAARVWELTPDTRYRVQVVARNAAQQPSAGSTGDAAWTAPAAPSQLSASVAGAFEVRVDLVAGANPALTPFEVWRVAPTPSWLLGSGTATHYVDRGLIPDRSYTYQARAISAHAESGQRSAWSAPATAITPATAPAPPQVFARSDSTLRMHLASGGDPNPATTLMAFTVDGRYLEADGALGSAQPEPHYFKPAQQLSTVIARDLVADTPYAVALHASGQDGTMVSSLETTRSTRPLAPASISAEVSLGNVVLSWPASAATRYRVSRSTDCFNYTVVYEDVDTSYVDTAAPYTLFLCYRVVGLNGDSPPAESLDSAIDFVNLAADAPGPPTALVVRDDPVTSLTPTFSATYIDNGAPSNASSFRLTVVEHDSGRLVREVERTLSPALTPGQILSDEPLPLVLAPLPVAVQSGFTVVGAPDRTELYAFLGGQDRSLRKLGLDRNVWSGVATLPAAAATPGAGARLAYDSAGSSLIALLAGGSDQIARFELDVSAWTALEQIDCGGAGAGSALATAPVDDGVLFVYPGSGDRLWVHDARTLAWDCAGLALPFDGGGAAALAVEGDLLFAQPAGSAHGLAVLDLSAFDLASASYGSWQLGAALGISIGSGGSLVAAGAGTLFAIPGGGSTALYRYDHDQLTPAGGAWTYLGTLPANVGSSLEGDRLAYDQVSGRVAIVGGEVPDLWSYRADEGIVGAARDVHQDRAAPLILDGRSYRFQFTFYDSLHRGASSVEQPFFTSAP